LATLDGQGIAYAPLWLFEDALADGRVRMLLPDWQSPSVPIHLVTPPHRQESAKVRALMDYMIDAFHG
jgi:DNA-binding transcriptional LysR family regulator